MKRLLFLIISALLYSSLVQANTVDTVIVISSKFKEVNSMQPCDILFHNDTIVLTKNKAPDDERAVNVLLKYPYCKFYDKKGRLIEECNWQGETFTGYYKAYFPNGIKKKEGEYSSNVKKGTWKYYNSKGVLIKEEQYNDKGILQDSKKY